MLDEPTAHVDNASKKAIYDLLSTIQQKTAIILVTHDMFAISSGVQKVVCINKKSTDLGKPESTLNLIEKFYDCSHNLILPDGTHNVLEVHRD